MCERCRLGVAGRTMTAECVECLYVGKTSEVKKIKIFPE